MLHNTTYNNIIYHSITYYNINQHNTTCIYNIYNNFIRLYIITYKLTLYDKLLQLYTITYTIRHYITIYNNFIQQLT